MHRTNDLVGLAEGEIEVEIEGKVQRPQIDQEVFIPANAVHTVTNVGQRINVWYYGYSKEDFYIKILLEKQRNYEY